MSHLLAAILAAAALEVNAAPAPNDSLLVTASWLASRLDEPNLVILHVGRDEDEFRTGHVPGARFISDRSLADNRDEGIYDVRPVPDLVAAFESVGLRDGARVVIYGHPLRAGRTFFTLEYLGFDGRVSLLDGGFERWRGDGLPISTDPSPSARGAFTVNLNPRILVDADWVETKLDDDAYALVDARPRGEFGQGHIAGAGSLYYEEALTDGAVPVLKDQPTLRRLFAEAGMGDGRTVVTYCAIGMRASFLYFVARYLGYDAAMYDGSIHDWRMVRGKPVVAGNE